MKRKIHVMLLMVFLLLFMGMPIYAAEEISDEASPETPVIVSQPSSTNQQEEDTKKEVDAGKEGTASGNLTEANVDERSRDSKLGVDNPKPVTKVTKTDGDEASKEQPSNTEEPKASKDENQPEAKAQDKKEDATEEDATEEKTPEVDPATNPNNEPLKASEASAEGGEASEEGTGQEPKESKPQVNPDEDKDLSELKAEIEKETDPDKKKALEKEYTEKYLTEVEKAGADKLDKDVVNGITDPEKIGQYKEIQALYDKIQADKNEGNLNQEDIDKLNALLGEFKPPRKLTADEEKVREGLDKDLEIPRVEKDTEDKVFEKYQNARKALEKALDPNEDPVTPEELKELQDAYKKAKAALDKAIKDEKINPKYTEDGKPEVKVYPLDGSTAGKELDKETYYIPDKTSTNLLIEVRKDKEEGSNKFKFTIKPNKSEENIPDAVLQNLVNFKNGESITLQKDDEGNYYFETTKDFEIAQIQMNLPAFRAAFHEGFKIEMKAEGQDPVTKEFLITKKGYDDADIGTIGTEKPKDPQEIDGGDTTDGIVDEDTKKVYDIFAMIKETDGYIDDVIVNSGNGESLPLSSVDITITLPKYNNDFADYLYKSGLEYQEIEKGKYQLKLQMKNFGGNLTEKDGKLYLDGKEITKAELRDKILEEAGNKVYVDKKGEKHDVTTEEYYEVTDDNGNTFKVQAGKLYKKDGETFTEIGVFKNGKLKDKNTTYVFNNGKLISYTDEKDLFEGNVSNKDGEADLDVTPTYDGDQVIVNTTTDDDKTKQAYGGTIIENGIFDKDGKYTGKTSSADGYQGYETAYVDVNGKILKDEAGNVVTSLSEEQEEKYTKAEKAVFNSDGFIVSGLTYNNGYTLIDKFGRTMDVKVTKGNDGKYSFRKGDQTQTQDDTNIKVENGKKFVGNDNYIVDQNGYEGIAGKYYYDGKKFVPVKDNDKGIKGNKYFKDYTSSDMDHKKVDSYLDENENKVTLDGDKTIYHGSTNPEDYVSIDGKTYVKKQAGSLVYYVGVDTDNQADILSVDQISKIVQILKDENGNEYEKLTDETDISQAVKNAKFQIKFPGFLAGEEIVYNIHADIKAKYLAPNPKFDPKERESETNPRFIEQSIFKGKQGNVVPEKSIDKYFTLKVKEGTPASFFKNPPKELLAKPDYNFFNIFYRDKSDRDRDDYIKHLLGIAANEEERVKPENKADMTILNKIQSELGRLYDGAKFALVEKNGKKELVILDKNDEEITLDRSLLWEVGFNNPDGALFPENKDSEIIIEDHNMDNRLIYDEIIVNDTQEKWNAAKKEFEAKEENKGKKFGNEEYFFIDQIKDIRFGVSPNYIDGRFVPLGENFKITSEEILKALEAEQTGDITDSEGNVIVNVVVKEGKKYIKKDEILFEVRRDEANGQIRIKVMNAFYAEAQKGSENKFESPVQKAYQEKIDGVLGEVEKLTLESDNTFIEGLVKKLHAEDSECFGIIKQKLTKELDKIKGISDDTEKTNAFNSFKENLKKEIQNLRLEYLDKSKHKDKNNKSIYNYDDMRFNAIRIGLKPGLRIGGPTDPVQTKKLGIASVIIPEVDIPYTDEFGNALTNKDKYVQEAIGEIIKDHKFNDTKDDTFKFFDDQGNPIWNKSEDSFRKVMEEAYRRVNEKIEKKEITIKTLVEVAEKLYGQGKFTVIAGNDSKLSFDDLANGDKALKDSKGQPLNPYYVGDKKEDGTVTTIADKINNPELEKTDAYNELINRPIDIAGYYMSKLGYNGAMYANFANYKLVGGKDQAPGIFGKDDDWHKKICYPGLGSCIENAGGDSESDKTEGGNKYGSEGEAGSEFELTYEPTPKTPDEEHPKVDKKSETDKVDVSKEQDKKVDFTIDVTVDKMKKDQKELSEALKTKPEEIVDANNYDEKTGYYIYRDGLIIDILPDIFEFIDETKISIEVDQAAMKANGANAKLNFEEFKSGIKYLYKEDVKAYLAELKAKGEDKKYNVLLKALGGDESKIKDGQRAILAWLPEFEGPHGAKNQFTMKLTKLLLNKEKYKESEEYKNQGQPYTNKAGFGDKGEFFFGTKTITVTDGHKANVNKYLQLLDKDGNVINKDEAGEWFKGSATLKFGDKFNYKIKYYLDNKGLVDTGFVQKDKEWKLEDLFDSRDKNGLRPVLRDFVEEKNGFTVQYKVGDKFYSKDEMQNQNISLAKVEGIKINPPEAGFPYNESREFILPMMIPELDARIENGKVIYTGTDGKDVVLGNADDFFNLKDLTNKDAKMYFENKVEKSNTVTVYLEKERFIKLFKEFFEADGKTEIKKDRPEVKFYIYQIVTDEDGKVVDKIKLDKGLTLNEANDFVDQVNHLPLFKRIEEMDEKGNVTVKILSYTYEVKEQAIEGYTGKVFKFDEKDALGFVLKAENYKKPEKPENPPEEPKNPPEEPKNPPEEPETPPETPEKPEKPEYPNKEDVPEKPETGKVDQGKNYPKTPDKPHGKNNLPKTGLVEDLSLLYLSGLAFVVLLFLRRKKFAR